MRVVGDGEYTYPRTPRKSKGLTLKEAGPRFGPVGPRSPQRDVDMLRSTVRSRVSTLLAILAPIQLWGCSGGDAAEPTESVAFLVGNWDADRFVVKSKTNPELALELIKGLGAQFSVNIQPSGQYTAILVFQATPFTEIGIIEVKGDEMIFHVAYPQAETNRSRYTRSGNFMTLTGDTRFDFNLDGQTEPAEARIELHRR